MGYRLDPDAVPRTIDFYLARTSHGSTLSRLVHSWVLARADRHRSWSLFTEALDADLADTQGGTTREGVHLAAMAGTVDLLLRCYSGLEARDDVLWLPPALPPELSRVEFQITYRGQPVRLERTPSLLRLRLRACAAARCASRASAPRCTRRRPRGRAAVSDCEQVVPADTGTHATIRPRPRREVPETERQRPAAAVTNTSGPAASVQPHRQRIRTAVLVEEKTSDPDDQVCRGEKQHEPATVPPMEPMRHGTIRCPPSGSGVADEPECRGLRCSADAAWSWSRRSWCDRSGGSNDGRRG
jgi:hypothetical protein